MKHSYKLQIKISPVQWVQWLSMITYALLLSCTDPSEEAINQHPTEHVELSIQVNPHALTKGQGDGYLPDASKIGVFLKANDGTPYEGQAYDNITYTAAGSDAAQSWSADPTHPIILNHTKGTAYAYYPYQSGGVAFNSITMLNDGTDWMYTKEPVSNISIKNPVAQLELIHAFAIVRCHLQKGDYTDLGTLQGISVASATLAQGATLDLQTGLFNNPVATGADISSSLNTTLATEPLTVDLWAFPLDIDGKLDLKLHIDGHTLTVQSNPMTIKAGVVYDFTLSVNHETLDITAVTLSDWVEIENAELASSFDASDHTINWETAKTTDGIYAITQAGRALPAEYANGSSYVGVAFVLRGKIYEIAPTEPDGLFSTKHKFYWHKTDYVDIEALPNYRTVEGNFETVYYDGVTIPQVELDERHWLFDALSDFNGEENTAAIITAQTVDANPLDETITKTLLTYRESVGQDSWFIPAYGQLVYMMTHYEEINAVLTKIAGSHLIDQDYYVSSTERSSSSIWYFNFPESRLTYAWKTTLMRTRFIRNM